MDRKSVCLVITAHNMAECIEECLASVASQSYSNFDAIVIEDGSSDDTYRIADNFISSDPRFSIIHTDIRNAGGARNYGMKLVDAPYFMLLDGDDVFHPKMLESLYSSIHQSNADIAVCDYTQFDHGTRKMIPAPWALRVSQLPEQAVFSWRDVPGNIFAAFTGCPWNKLYRTEFVRHTGLMFPEDMSNSEDTPFVFPALIMANRITVVNEVLIDRRIGRSASVESSRARESSALYECICRVKSFLQALPEDSWQLLQQDFLNWAFDLTLWNIETISDEATQNELVKKLCANEFHELELAEHDPSYFTEYPRSMARYATILSACPKPDGGPLGKLQNLPYGKYKPWCQANFFDKVTIKWRIWRNKPVEW